jgi:DNA-binding transcriptional LysR family regulator
MESNVDMNLLVALDALLTERSVGLAAQRLHTSAPAMSRTLGRLRRLLDDPVLVRAGRTMVPTPRALELHAAVSDVVDRAQRLLTVSHPPDLATLERTFALQAGEGLFSAVWTQLLARVRAEAPGVTLRFVAESHEETQSLRDGLVDLEFGQIRRTAPETIIEPLLTEPWVGVVRADHDLTRRRVTPARFAAAEHVVFSRRGRLRGPLDDALAERGLTRRVVACAPSPAAGLFLIKDSDLVGMLPARMGAEAVRGWGLTTFPLPVPLPPLQIGMAWHPRLDADGAHRWLRQVIRDIITASGNDAASR